MADDAKETKNGDLIKEACKAFGIGKEFVLASAINGDEAVILTVGGKRMRYKSGDKVDKLDEISVTGVNPKKRKPITGDKKEK